MSFSVFGNRPENSICLPDIPYAVRFNCKDGGGGIFVGGSDPQHRKTNPEDKVDINIIKVSKYFGSLGTTENILWLQLFFVPAPNVDVKILPKNTVCVGYLKKQSISALFNKVQEAMIHGDPGLGIFTLSFIKEIGSLGSYYSVGFDWRERKDDEEKQQLELIKGFMSEYSSQLIDLEGIRSMTCINDWNASEIQSLIMETRNMAIASEPKSLPPAAKNQRRLTGR
jgi:hypothetical protein